MGIEEVYESEVVLILELNGRQYRISDGTMRHNFEFSEDGSLTLTNTLEAVAELLRGTLDELEKGN